ncbi:uncharacterized protein LOC118274573 isoform X3 [Spodoptera frugiperda]|uniref:Uncharacterized protein LOC118274573 isoform X3 n=2 Tax=Spodoptera frugiperda TaxID=7108 RepID=A0A9R0EVL2_SPOFR|nr:uncharacterized protein LOC118274573 isoform X3 [Spodoptera frugiperda]XP_050552680.1 uncharacterized protein LOC118274573 isoform X3 [Spodoptera frugiperda]XP_050552681.1 uncharacterized protein LOC118274573 isoform X3 [Spodoptera frugiperda]
MVKQCSDAVHWYMEEVGARVVAKTGIPSDRHHLGKLMLHSLQDDPDFILQIDGATGESETFSSVLDRSIRCAVSLTNMGLKQGDVMVLMGPNHLDYCIPHTAGLFLGLKVASIDATLCVNELEQLFETNRPKIIFGQTTKLEDIYKALSLSNMDAKVVTFDNDSNSTLAQLLKDADEESVENFKPTDFDPSSTIAFLTSTSGTTGIPKTAMITHENLAISLPYIWKTMSNFPSPVKTAFVVSPAQWITTGFSYIISPVLKVTRLQTSAPVTPEHFGELVDKYRPGYILCNPVLMKRLAEQAKCDFTCFKHMTLGGSFVPQELVDTMKKLTQSENVFVMYGMSELSGTAFFNDCTLPPGSCGRPAGSFDCKLVDPETHKEVTEPHVPGELWFKGPAVFKGYHNNPEVTRETFSDDGWFRCGDIFYRDESWNVYFVERYKSLLKYNNHQVSPLEVEMTIMKHPGVLQVAVTGIPDRECGDLVVACVVPKPGCSPTAQEIKDLVKETLKSTMVKRGNDAVHWYMEEVGARVVAKTGIPSDRHHLGKLILHSLQDDPDFILQIDGATGESETFGSALDRSIRCAVSLTNMGLKQGDVMVLMGPNHIDYCIPHTAGLFLGLKVASIDATLCVNELKQLFETNRPKIIFAQTKKLGDINEALSASKVDAKIVTFDNISIYKTMTELLNDADEASVKKFQPTDFDPSSTIAFLTSTSGTTGIPKTAMITHENLAISLPYIWKTMSKFPSPIKISFVVSPAQWITTGFNYIFSPVLKFTRLQTSKPVTPEHFGDLVNKYRPNYILCNPVLMRTLAEQANCDFTCFEQMSLAGSYVSPELVEKMKKLTQSEDVFIHYGMSELSGTAFVHDCPAPPGSCGRPAGSFDCKLVDPETHKEVTEPHVQGELWFKGPAVFKGYHNNPEVTRETFSDDGWFRCGDIFYRDESWNVYFVERYKSLLKYNNHQVSPLEVEMVIMKHPGVLQVAVTGIPDRECGDLVVACVVPKPGCSLTAQEIKDLVKENLTDTKHLRGGVIFMKSLPITSASKINRQKLKELALTMRRE